MERTLKVLKVVRGVLFPVTFVVFFLGFFDVIPIAAVFPIFGGLIAFQIVLAVFIGGMQARGGISMLAQVLSGKKGHDAEGEFVPVYDTAVPAALEAFRGVPDPVVEAAAGHTRGQPSRVSFAHLTAADGGKYLVTVATVHAPEARGTVVALRRGGAPWAQASNALADAPAVTEGSWTIRASDPAAAASALTPAARRELSLGSRGVDAVVWTDGEVSAVLSGHRATGDPKVRALAMAASIAGLSEWSPGADAGSSETAPPGFS